MAPRGRKPKPTHLKLVTGNPEEFAGPEAPVMDLVFTVCDSAAGEACPVWPGHPVIGHWGVPDPAAAVGTETQRRLAFAESYRMLANRISAFVSLSFASLGRVAFESRLRQIGQAPRDSQAEPS